MSYSEDKYTQFAIKTIINCLCRQGSSKVCIQDTLVFPICLMCWGGHLFHKGDRRLDLFCFTKLLTVWHKCPSKVEAYKGIRGKHNMKFRQIGHTTSRYGQSFFPNTISAWNWFAFAEVPSLAVFSTISVHVFRIIP